MPLNDILRSGVNTVNRASAAAGSGIRSFDVGQFNQGLTQGLDRLGGVSAQAGGLLDQAGALSRTAGGAFSNLDSFANFSSPLRNIDRVFTGKIDNLSRANIIGVSQEITSSVSDASSLFNRNSVNQTLSGIRNNIKVLPEEFSAVTGQISEVTGAVRDLRNAGTSLAGSVQEAFSTVGNFGQAVSNALDFSTIGGGNRADSLGSIQLTPSETGTGARLPNPLREYASYNYILELSALSALEINSPEDSYRNGFSNSIVRSGGGNYNNRVTTFAEDTLGSHAEYYIDDLEITSLMSPNRLTGVTQGTSIRFTITEPYSMGQFLEALQIAANQAGHESYTEAPYALKMDFLGLDQDGRVISGVAAPPKFIPIKLTNVEFDVRGEGSVYQVEAIPYNELAFTTQTSIIRTDVNISGRTVLEALQTGNPDNPRMPPLADILNARGDSLVDAGAYSTPDRYIIMFPPDSQGATAAVSRAREADFGSGSSATLNPNGSRVSDAALARIDAEPTVNLPSGGVYETLKDYAANNVNEIGRSVIIDDVNQDGDRNFASPAETYRNEVANRSEAEGQSDETTRNANYSQNTSILSIIEDMILTSEYGRGLVEQGQTEEGLREWFRIETQVFIEEDPVAERTRGRSPKIYVYSVVPFFPDSSRFQGASQRPSNAQLLENLAAKEYNYYYTGTNEDVLDFKIDFKTAFFQNLFADLGQHSAALRTRETGETIDRGEYDYAEHAPPGVGAFSNGQLSEPHVPVEEITTSTDHPNGGIRLSAAVAAKRSIAQAYHDTLINSDVDLVNAELEIWGDPYWIPESGLGNYNAAPSGILPSITADGTVTPQHSDVFVKLNFRTPFDYNNNTGLMDFSNIVKPFSGNYMVNRVENYFSSGKFTQKLIMMRQRGQGDEGTGNTDVMRLGNNQIISGQNRAAEGQATGEATAGQPNNSGVTGVSGQGAVPSTGGGTGANGEQIPRQGGGSLSTITTSKRGIQTEVASVIAADMQGFIDELENEYGYEITQFGGYVDRYIAGTTTKSWHASGIAIDINWSTNPDGDTLITDLPYPPSGSEMTALAAKYGLGWGGDWTGGYIDAMHFSAASNERGTLIVQRGVIPSENRVG